MSDPETIAVANAFSVEGLRVAVTAAGQGIGRAMAERFSAGGAKVAACDVNGDLLTELQRDLPDIHLSVADVTNTAQVEAFFKTASGRLGGIDVLVNNAGIGGGRAAIEDIEYEDWNRTVAVNLNGMFYCIKQVTPIMKQQSSGCIVNISTSSVRTGLPYRASYVASKAGVLGLTYNVARELGQFNIRCNAILPGMINNPRGRALIERAAKESGRTFAQVEEEVMKYVSMRAWIEPSEIADAAIFFASGAGRHISGQFLGVCANTEWES